MVAQVGHGGRHSKNVLLATTLRKNEGHMLPRRDSNDSCIGVCLLSDNTSSDKPERWPSDLRSVYN